MSTELATAYISVLPSAKGFTGNLGRQLGGLDRVADGAGSKAGDGFSRKFVDGAKKGMLAGGATLGVLAAKGVVDSLDIEKGNDKLAAQLGATGQYAADIGKIAGGLYADGYGESLSDINGALKNVLQQGLLPEDATDAQIQRITEKVVNLGETFEQDLGGASAAVATMIRTGLVKDADEALDIITRGFQQGVDKQGDYLDTLTEYSTLFRNLGLDGKAATGLLSQGLSAGARDADKVADALKEFSIRAVDGSKLTAEGFKMIGLNGEDMAQRIGKGGPTAAAALDLTLKRLRLIEDPAKRAQAAVALFGTQSEDLGAALFALDPTKAALALGDVAGAADKMGDTLNGNAATKIESFKRKALQGLANVVGTYVLPVATKLGDVAGRYLPPLIDKGGAAVDRIAAAVQRVDWDATFAKAKEIVAPIVASVVELATAVSEFAVEAWPKVQSGLQTALPIVQSVVTALAGGLTDTIRFLTVHMDTLGPAVLAAAGAFTAFKAVKGTVSVFQSATEAARNLRADLARIRDGFSKAGDAASAAAAPIKRFFQPGGGSDTLRLKAWEARDAIKSTASTLKSGVGTMASWGKAQAVAAANTVRSTAAWVAQKTALVAAKAATLAMSAAQKVATAAQWAFNTAMSANPIGLAVIAIAALVAGFVLAYKKVGWFRTAVDTAFRGIKAVVGAVIGFIRDNWKLVLGIITGPIGLAVLIVTSHWDKIKGAALAVFDWVKRNWPLLLAIITGPIGLAVLAVVKHWDKIKAGFGAVRDYIRGRVSDVVGFVKGIPERLTKIAGSLKDALLAPFKAAFRAIAKLWNSTVGKLSFEVPSWVPGGIGGKGWSVPKIDEGAFDKYHSGGRLRRIPGRRGQEVPFIGLAGERVLTPAQTRIWERTAGGSAGAGGSGPLIGSVSVRDNTMVRDLQWFARKQARAAEVLV